MPQGTPPGCRNAKSALSAPTMTEIYLYTIIQGDQTVLGTAFVRL